MINWGCGTFLLQFGSSFREHTRAKPAYEIEQREREGERKKAPNCTSNCNCEEIGFEGYLVVMASVCLACAQVLEFRANLGDTTMARAERLEHKATADDPKKTHIKRITHLPFMLCLV